MKKLFAALVALCMLCSFAMAEQQVVEFNWADVEEAASGIDGQFVAIANTGYEMFVPSVFTEMELTEEQVANGFISILTTEDQSCAITIFWQDLGDLTIEDYENVLKESGAQELEYGLLNGVPALSYSMEADGVETASVVVDVDDTMVMTINFAPVSDEGFSAVAAIMTCSIRRAE